MMYMTVSNYGCRKMRTAGCWHLSGNTKARGVCQAGGDNPHRYERLVFCVKDSLGTCFGFRERPDISEALFTEVNYLVI